MTPSPNGLQQDRVRARLIVGVKNVARGTSRAGRTGPHAPYIYVKYISDAYSFSPKLMIS